jgi:DNA-binding CsgD family transcriptional regulator
MELQTSEISYYKSLLAKKLKDAFLYEKDLSPVDRQVLVEKYKSLLDNINGFIIICNYTTGLYEYISDGIRTHLGYDVKGFSNEELTGFVFSVIHDNHRNFLLNSLLPAVFNYFKQHGSQINPTDVRYTCSIKVKNKYDTYVWYLIDTVIIEADENKSPQRTLITCTNINQFKKDEIVYYNIQKKNQDGVYEIILEGTDDHKKLEYNLTPRELQIISMVSHGNTNQEIADKIFVSLNTVKTHRKNIMKKTRCKGTADLTNFAFSRGLL